MSEKFNTLGRKIDPEHFQRIARIDPVYRKLGITHSQQVDSEAWRAIFPFLSEGSSTYYAHLNQGGPLTSRASKVWRQWVAAEGAGVDMRRSRMMAVACEAIERSSRDRVNLVLSSGAGYDAAVFAMAYPERQFLATEACEEAFKSSAILRGALELRNLGLYFIDNEKLVAESNIDHFGAVVGNWSLSGSADPGRILRRICDLSEAVALTESPVARWHQNPEALAFPDDPFYHFVESRDLEGEPVAVPKVYVNDLESALGNNCRVSLDTRAEVLDEKEYDSYLIEPASTAEAQYSDVLLFRHHERIEQVRAEIKKRLRF